MTFLKALLHRHITLLWISQVLSAMGDYLYSIAVMWLAVKSVGSEAGIIAVAEAGSALFFGLPGGVYADRWDRRKVMVVVDIVRMAAVATLPVLNGLGMLQFWHFVVVAIVIGSLGSLFDPALQASLPALAGDIPTLQAMNGLMDITTRLARALGPSMAGLLVAFMPLPQFFTLDAVSFAISAMAILALGRQFAWRTHCSQKQSAGIASVLREITGSVHLLSTHRPLAWALTTNAVINMLWSAAFVVGVPMFVDHALSGNVAAYGLIVGAYGVGNVVSNLVIGSIVVRRRVLMIFVGKIVLGGGFLLLATASTLPVAMLGSAVAAIGGPMGDIVMLVMIQTELPGDQVGKMYSLRMVMANGGGSLGLLLAVPLFAHCNVMLAIVLCALGMIAVGVVGIIRFGFAEPSVAAISPPASR